MRISGDDSEAFPDVEAAHLREHWLPTFDWLRYPQPSPRHRLRVPLSQARVGLASTAGAHRAGEPPLGAGGRAAVLGIDDDIVFTHVGFDTERAQRDPDAVYPVRSLRRLEAEGFIGELAPTTLSTMGGALIGSRIVERAGPAAVAWAQQERLDLVLLTPA